MTTDGGFETTEPLWPLCGVSVRKLFGVRSFPLRLDELLTIVTGENGSGKSTILRAIHLVSQGQWARFAALPLEGLTLVFHDESELAIDKTEQGLVISGRGDPWILDLDAYDPADPQRRREALQLRRAIEAGRIHSAEEEATYRRLYAARRAPAELFEPPEWLSSTVAKLHMKLISARRLEHRLRPERPDRRDDPGSVPVSVVDRFADDMRDRMRDQLSRYAADSQQQDKSLPSRIVEAMQMGSAEESETIAVEVDELRAEVRGLADSLARVGLFNEEDPDQQFEGYPRGNLNILLAVREVYLVARDRLSRLSRLRADLDLFATFLNDRLTDKRIELNQGTGIAVVLPTGERIRPSQLSSGEQQLLALAYELLFETKRSSLVLLDEPELSLHVGWLKGLIAAFLDVGERRGLQFLIATHSPSIVAGHGERERSLDIL